MSYLNANTGSEFDASHFSGVFSAVPRPATASELGIAGIGLGSRLSLQNYRPRSLMYLDDAEYWARPPPSRPVSLGYVNSLDRRGAAFPRRSPSVDALNMRILPDTFLLPSRYQPYPFIGSRSSLGAESDQLDRYRDVAL